MNQAPLLLPAVLLCLLSGCGGRYVCGVPEGRPCRSLAQVYQDIFSERGEAREFSKPRVAPSRAPSHSDWHAGRHAGRHPDKAPGKAFGPPRARVLEVEPGAYLLTRPRQLRLWVSGWEDSLGDLHSESFLYLRLEAGRWSTPWSGVDAEDLPGPSPEAP